MKKIFIGAMFFLAFSFTAYSQNIELNKQQYESLDPAVREFLEDQIVKEADPKATIVPTPEAEEVPLPAAPSNAKRQLCEARCDSKFAWIDLTCALAPFILTGANPGGVAAGAAMCPTIKKQLIDQCKASRCA